MKKKYLLLDPVSPRGHISLNRFYIKVLTGHDLKLVVSDELASEYSDICEVATFKARFLKLGRIVHSFYTLLLTFWFLVNVGFKEKRSIILLSYDITNFFIMSNLAKLLKVDLLVFEHNTAPGKNKFKKVLQQLCAKNIRRVCFSKSMKEEFDSLSITSKVIHHPIIREKASVRVRISLLKLVNDYDAIVFCPSASAELSKLEYFCDLYPSFLFIVKSAKNIAKENCFTSVFFEEYDWIMENADFVYLPINHTGRVSGPLYGAMCHSVKIVVNKNSFGEFCQSQFNGFVQYDNQPWAKNEQKFDIEAYNKKIIEKFNNYLQS